MTVAEVLRWYKQKRDKRNKKMKLVGPLTPPTKAPRARSYHGIATNDGSSMDRDTAASPELAKEKKKENKNTSKEKHYPTK